MRAAERQDAVVLLGISSSQSIIEFKNFNWNPDQPRTFSNFLLEQKRIAWFSGNT